MGSFAAYESQQRRDSDRLRQIAEMEIQRLKDLNVSLNNENVRLKTIAELAEFSRGSLMHKLENVDRVSKKRMKRIHKLNATIKKLRGWLDRAEQS